jgi:hypothetical protein
MEYPIEILQYDVDHYNMLNCQLSGIIDIKEIVNSTASSTKSSEATKKNSSKDKKIIKTNMKDKLDKKLKNSIQLMKTNENELITGDKPSISSLEGIINSDNTTISTKIINLPLDLKKEILGFLVDVVYSKWEMENIIRNNKGHVFYTNKSIKVYHEPILKLMLNRKPLVNCLKNYVGCIQLKKGYYHFFIMKDWFCPESEILYIGQKIEDAIYQLLVEKCGKSTCSCALKYKNILMSNILLEDIKNNHL